MAMCVWFPWLQRIQPQHGSGRSFPRKSRHNSVQKATSSELQDGNVVSEKPGSLQEAAEKISRDFELSDDDIRRISYGFVTQLEEGLCKHGSTIEQIPSFITKIPSGREKGTYLSIDLGGTNIRICAVDLHGDATYSLLQDKLVIPTALMTTKTSKDLFDWVAKAMQRFLQDNYPGSMVDDANVASEEQRVFKLGFTFSHAVHQQSINRGTLIRWSKGFDIEDAIGQDICALLQTAFDDLALPVRVTALINDTVGTLLAQAYGSLRRARTVLGAVFGTGTNGAYVETTSKITKLESCHTQSDAMIINTEWGNFDQDLMFLPDTIYDRAIDSGSVNPGFEMFEKRISGMYLGEILRLAVLSLVEDPCLDLFEGSPIPETSAVYVQWSLDSSFLSYLESDTSSDLSSSRSQIEQWAGVAPVSVTAARSIRMIALAIGRRSARLSAVALGAVLVKTDCLNRSLDGDEKISIGVDGSLIELYPGFVAEIRCALRCIEQIGERGETLVDITIAKDGSGVGAALAAHVVASGLGGSDTKVENP